ncbi:MAG TPA: hypothetical protein EYP64_00470 [Desulfarculaceae bacterium]|nr:hypothetical protein [Desulfarculaceae bacterium]
MDCRFCGKSAGFLRSAHRRCKTRHDNAVEEIITLIERYSTCRGNMPLLKRNIVKNAKNGFIRAKELSHIVAYAWEQEVETSFKKGLLTKQKEKNLTDLMKALSMSQTQLSKYAAHDKIVKGSMLRNLFSGIHPTETNYNGVLPFNLLKSEKLIWVFQGTDYLELKKRVSYAGRSQGASVRVAKGVCFRGSSYKGERIETEEINHADTGLFGITNKHIYFTGKTRSFRIKYGKIVSFEPLTDGIRLHRDAMTAKPQYFVTGDGWFTYNLVTNVAQL